MNVYKLNKVGCKGQLHSASQVYYMLGPTPGESLNFHCGPLHDGSLGWIEGSFNNRKYNDFVICSNPGWSSTPSGMSLQIP